MTNTKNSILYWKNEWTSGQFSTAEELMLRADAKYVELRNMGTWGRRSDKNQQIVALTAKVDALSKNNSSTNRASGASENARSNNQIPKWKLDRSLSKSTKYERNEKTYHWCTGPGHQGTGMWVIHEPGTCTSNNSTNNRSNNRDTSSSSTTKTNKAFDSKAFAAEMKDKGFSDDEIDSKVEAILAVSYLFLTAMPVAYYLFEVQAFVATGISVFF